VIAGEASRSFDCFGGRCAVHVIGDGPCGSASEAVEAASEMLLGWHQQFSRFRATSELSALNADPRPEVPVTPLMARFVEAAWLAGSLTDGLVDATLVSEIESVGYSTDLEPRSDLIRSLELWPPRRRAAPAPAGGWRTLEVSLTRGTVRRPPGVRIDSGGLAKGLFADVLSEILAEHDGFAVDCSGDLMIGGAAGLRRPVDVESPFDGSTLHRFDVVRSGVATSGISRRSWLDADGRPAHHLLDPATGRPAFTGVVQATALAPTALMAEVHAKAAVLSGPAGAAGRLPHGGVIVLDDGSHRVIEPPPTVTLGELSRYALVSR